MHEIFYKEDFRLTVAFNKPIDAGVDFRGVLYTAQTLATDRPRFGRRGQVLTACSLSDDGSQLIVAVDGNRLAPGPLILEMVYLVPSKEMPDGFRTVARRYSVDAVITSASPAHCCDSDDCACSPEPVRLDVEIPWQYVHDTDVYNEVLERVNGTFAAILGTEDVKPAPAPAEGSRAATRPMLRRGLLNLRSARPDCVYKSFESGQRMRVCVRLSAGEVADLSRWVNDEDYEAAIISEKVFSESHEVVKDGFKIKVEPADYTDRVCVALVCNGPESAYIRKREDGTICAATTGEFIYPAALKPTVGLEEIEDWVLTQLKLEENTGCQSPLNGMNIEIQRKRSRNKNTYARSRWRRWTPNVYTHNTQRRFSCAVIRARYHAKSNVVGPWSYFFFLYCSDAYTGKEFRAVCL